MPASSLPRILVTAGEPAGIGPDLCLQLAGPQSGCEIVVIADANLLRERAQKLDISVDIITITPTQLP
ncbi:MAG: 4-hydroxythreonine-4-phosphate dehydrogenase PdxA, partial [Gammaproteobacteria bacterium]|nr:4-hydroxythreonine-4-phosphate dehydrogenase PdxA [Gammaproteobacteria bacterium]